MDLVLHLAIAAGLTVVCVVITALIWKRAQVKTVFWWIGLTLVPASVYLLGLGPAAEGAARTLRQWWSTLNYTPAVWAGVALAAVAVFLMLGSRVLPSESSRDRRAARKAAAKSGPAPQSPAAATTPSPARPVTAGPQAAAGATKAPGKASGQAPAAGGDAEMDEIAELLRKRGIN